MLDGGVLGRMQWYPQGWFDGHHVYLYRFVSHPLQAAEQVVLGCLEACVAHASLAFLHCD